MTAPTPQPGEWWARTQRIEGEVVEVEVRRDGTYVWLSQRSGSRDGAYFGPLNGVTHHAWERLPDPEPEWQPGDVVDDAFGNRYCRMPDGWAGHPSANFGETYEWMRLDRSAGWGVKDAALNRPLTRLVPEVKP